MQNHNRANENSHKNASERVTNIQSHRDQSQGVINSHDSGSSVHNAERQSNGKLLTKF